MTQSDIGFLCLANIELVLIAISENIGLLALKKAEIFFWTCKFSKSKMKSAIDRENYKLMGKK